MLAELRGRPHIRRLLSITHVDRLTDHPDIAELRVVHGARDTEMLHLWFCEGLIDRVDRTAGDACLDGGVAHGATFSGFSAAARTDRARQGMGCVAPAEILNQRQPGAEARSALPAHIRRGM